VKKINASTFEVTAALQRQEIDTTPPRIVLYPKQRLVQNTLVIDTYQHTLTGQALDESGIASLSTANAPP